MIPTSDDNSIDVRALPPALDLTAAAELLGISRTAAYELVRSGSWPTPVLRLGCRIKIPTQPLEEEASAHD